MAVTFETHPIFQSMPDRLMAHCATVTVLPDGTRLAAWYAGSRETADRLKPAASHAVSTAVDKAGFFSSFS
jgi:predicted neuraminidase